MTKKFTLVAAIVFMFALTVSPAFAGLDANIVYNENAAQVQNEVGAQANSGMNYADGSYAGSGGDGGDIGRSHRRPGPPGPILANNEEENHHGSEVDESTTGNGGRGGDSAEGGTVVTGDALAEAEARNRVNWNNTEIEACPCEEGEMEEPNNDVETLNFLPPGHPPVPIRANLVINRNLGAVGNRVGAQANTGMNEADGSYSGQGGNGGDITASDVEESDTGNGGGGGNSGPGGLIQTGRSVSRSNAVNVINTNVTRIYRSPMAQ